jgi:Ca-activated chloride channel family protein
VGTLGHGTGTGQGYGRGTGTATTGSWASPIDPNGRFSTTYRPGAGHLSAFEAAVASGYVPASARELVADVGDRHAPTLALMDGRALAYAVDLERTALPPSGGPTHLRIALRSSPKSADGKRPTLAVSLVLDTSGSMSGEPIDKARLAAAELVEQLSPSDSFALVTFSSNAELTVRPGLIAGRKPHILRAIADTQASGGTNIGEGLAQAYALAKAEASQRGVVPVVLLLSDGQATSGNTDRGYLAGQALQAFQDGVQTSTFGLGQAYDEALMSSIAADGAGGYYYLREVDQIASAFRSEIAQRLDPAATAVELRVRLDDDVSLLHVYGSERLGELDAARERSKEVAADQQAAKRYGIAQDRKQDHHGGMRFFIPAFARDDAHSLLLQVALPPGVGQRSVGTIELKYKDRLYERNVVEEIPVRIGFAPSDAASAASLSASVTQTVQGYRAGEDMLFASRLVAAGQSLAAVGLLRERASVLHQLAAHDDLVAFERHATQLVRLAQLAASPNEPRALALVFETAARSRLR